MEPELAYETTYHRGDRPIKGLTNLQINQYSLQKNVHYGDSRDYPRGQAEKRTPQFLA